MYIIVYNCMRVCVCVCVCVCLCVFVCVCIYIILILIYLSIFLYVCTISCKEMKLRLFDSNFMLTWCSWTPK